MPLGAGLWLPDESDVVDGLPPFSAPLVARDPAEPVASVATRPSEAVVPATVDPCLRPAPTVPRASVAPAAPAPCPAPAAVPAALLPSAARRDPSRIPALDVPAAVERAAALSRAASRVRAAACARSSSLTCAPPKGLPNPPAAPPRTPPPSSCAWAGRAAADSSTIAALAKRWLVLMVVSSSRPRSVRDLSSSTTTGRPGFFPAGLETSYLTYCDRRPA